MKYRVLAVRAARRFMVVKFETKEFGINPATCTLCISRITFELLVTVIRTPVRGLDLRTAIPGWKALTKLKRLGN